MTAEQTQQKPTSRLSRRAVVTAGAWSAPVIAAAVASPLAAASTTPLEGWDLRAYPPNAGGGGSAYTADFTGRYTIDSTIGLRIGNPGTLASPSGVRILVQYDRRFRSVEALSYWSLDTDDRGRLEIDSVTTDGDLVSAIATVPFVFQPGVPGGDFDLTNTVLFGIVGEWTNVYPNDGIDGLQSTVMSVLTPPGDLDPSNQSRSVDTVGAITPITGVWGVHAEPTFENYDYPNGLGSLERVSHARWTVTGPNPTLAGGRFTVTTPGRIFEDLTISNVTLDGAAAPSGFLTQVPRDPGEDYWQVYREHTTDRDLVAGQVVEFDVAYTPRAITELPEHVYGSGVSFQTLLQSYDVIRGEWSAFSSVFTRGTEDPA